MAPSHGGVALMAALAAAALLLTLVPAVASARVRNLSDGTGEHAFLRISSAVKDVPFTMTESERVNTLKVLQAFAAAMPSLGWSGDDFCSWSGVTCFANVSIVVSRSWVTGTLPEMPDDVDYSMVRLNEISIFGQQRGITGTLPSSWSKLRKVRTINLAFISVSGTLPAAWASMALIEQVVVATTQLSGTLPQSWSTMANLRRIHFQGCNLYGSLPESWARMPSLERLNLRNNKFCGCVPQSWLMLRTLRVYVDRRHKFPHCLWGEACVETTTPEPIGSSGSSTVTAELTTLPPPSDHQCKVPNCILCLPRDSYLCAVCVDGYVMTDDWQCRNSTEWEAVPFTMSEAERGSTLKVLQAFAAAMPSLGWSGHDFCGWSGVTCLADSVSVILAHSVVTGTLPEMPDDVDYSMVKLSEISIFGQHSGITGTLPSSWGKLRTLQIINVAYTGISGTLPGGWITLPNLRRVYLQGCSLSGSLPESWAQMPSLERLDLRNNNFCGCVPLSWLMSRTLGVDVDKRHNFPHCLWGEACVETGTSEPIGSSGSSTVTAELTTLPPPSDHPCKVPNCTSCRPRDSQLCAVCVEGYLLTDDWQCMKSPEWEALPLAMTEAERGNTLKVLQAVAAAMPSLGWSGDDFCGWRGVICTGANVSVILTRSGVTGTLPEMPDDVDYSMVKLSEISTFGQHRGITGTLPSSWGKLRTLQIINFASTGISGTLPGAWSSMAAIEQIILFNTEISGTLPEAWSSLPKLRRIDLERCNLYGSLPEPWARMPSLERLSLHNNSFCGCVPESWLSSPTLLRGVEAKHRMTGCATAETCTETTTTTLVPPSHPQCYVPMCVWCFAGDSNLCGVCSYGYVLTDDWQCMQRPHLVEAIPFTISEAEWWNTLKVLQAFAAAMPSLGWSGDDFCGWSGATCFNENVSLLFTRSGVTGTLPEMPDDVDYSMVRLDQIKFFGDNSGITGTLPSSWGKLRKVRALRLGYTGISGTLPAAWSSMEAMEQIVISNTQITGTLPEAWSTMPNLRRIFLQNCNLNGSLPDSWGRMASLERLDLRNNDFCGCVPLSWLMSRRLRVDVDTRHKFPHCSRAEACVETRTPEPIGSSGSSTSMAELSTVPPPSDHQCSVPNCVSCFPRDSKLCAVCMDGYVLREDGQCMQHPEWEPVSLAMSEAEWWNTLKVLQAFAAAMPSLGWSGDNFCRWRGVKCLRDSVSVILARSGVTGTLPEMPDDVDYSMVRLDDINIFGHRSGFTGTLPSSWGKLRKVRAVSLGYMSLSGTLPVSWASMGSLRVLRLRSVNVSGTLPAAWSSMEAMEEIMMFNTGITGTLPEAWSTMPKLARIDLERCKLYGSLPESWARMPSLEHLSLRNNDLCGCVPETWLTSPTLFLSVDTKHLLRNCTTEEARVEATAARPGAG